MLKIWFTLIETLATEIFSLSEDHIFLLIIIHVKLRTPIPNLMFPRIC